MAPINLPDGSQVSEIVLPDGSTASEVLAPDGSTVFGGIPDSEGFEHNDLTGVYAGDLSPFNIQTGTVDEGTYALFGDGEGNNAVIVRTTEEKFGRNGLRMSWRQYNPNVTFNGGPGIFTDQVGFSSNSGYFFTTDASGGEIEINKIDGGNRTTIAETGASLSTNTWVNGQVEFKTNDSIEYTFEGTTVSVTDSDFKSVYLGFNTFQDVFIDNLTFETI